MGHVPRLPPAPSTCAATSAVTDTDGPARPPRVALPTVADGVAVLVPAADASSGTVKGPTGWVCRPWPVFGPRQALRRGVKGCPVRAVLERRVGLPRNATDRHADAVGEGGGVVS